MDIPNGGEQSLVYLPREIIEIILPNLPVKSLLRFRRVSKLWRSLIDSKISISEYCSIIYDESWKVNEPINDPLTTGNIVGCCNGVKCILKNECFFLWNPATRISIDLPTFAIAGSFGWEEKRCGFGWDEESDAYKVFVSINDKYESLSHVYSLKTNSWKEVDCGKLYYCGAYDLFNVGVLACGKIHWVPEKGVLIPDSENNYIETCIIEYFDLKSEVFGRIELPSEPERGVGRWWLRERGGCLQALYYHKDDNKGRRRYMLYMNNLRGGKETIEREREREREREKDKRRRRRQRRRGEEEGELLDVWVMEEYGVKESWVKTSTISIPNPKSTLDYQQYVYVVSLVSPICDVDAEQRN